MMVDRAARGGGDPSRPFAGYYSGRFPTPRQQEQR